MTKRVLFCIGTRPEAIKLAPVIRALDADPRFLVSVCATGQHRELLDQALDAWGIQPDHHLDLMRRGQTPDSIAAAILSRLPEVLCAERPDWLVVQGDTTTAAASALVGFHNRVRVAHVEAGLRTGDLADPFPEEGNRRLIATLASLHLAPTERARAALLAENIPAQRIRVTGNTVVDALQAARVRLLARPPEVTALQAMLPPPDDARRILLVTLHRRENLAQGLASVAMALRQLSERGDVFLALPMHPNPRIRAVLARKLPAGRHVALLPPLPPLAFLSLLERCHFVLTDSGGVQEEAPAFGKPVLVLRDRTERPEAVEAGTARLVGTVPARILAEANRLLDEPAAYAAMARVHNPFGDGHAALRIRDALAGRIALPALAA
jgi:UDP-N-acetylglucosamine 2-epimerase (non-hydrolysing)